MSRTRILLLLCTLTALASLSSCWDDDESEVVYTNWNNALIYSFALKDNANVAAGLSSYAFTVDQFGNSDPALVARHPEVEGTAGIIFNCDSLPRGSAPDSVKFTLTYAAPDSVIVEHYDYDGALQVRRQYHSDSAYWFTEYAETRIIVLADDHLTRKTYFLKINVHEVAGDTIAWSYVHPEGTSGAWPAYAAADVTAQRADTLTDGRVCWLRTFADGRQQASVATLAGGLTDWDDAADISAPEALDLSTLYHWRGRLYAVGAATGALLASADGRTWTVESSDYRFVSLLGAQHASRWYAADLKAVAQVDGGYAAVRSTDGQTWSVYQAELPASFPIRGFTRPVSTAAHPELGNITSRIYITGGETADGRLSNSSWSCDGTDAGWVEFAHNEGFPAMSGASVVPYTLDVDHPATFWILHPGVEADGTVSRTLWYSENSGISWQKLSRWYSQYADNSMIEPVGCASAFCRPSDYTIYFIGGTDADGRQVSTLYGGALRSLTFWKRR